MTHILKALNPNSMRAWSSTGVVPGPLREICSYVGGALAAVGPLEYRVTIRRAFNSWGVVSFLPRREEAPAARRAPLTATGELHIQSDASFTRAGSRGAGLVLDRATEKFTGFSVDTAAFELSNSAQAEVIAAVLACLIGSPSAAPATIRTDHKPGVTMLRLLADGVAPPFTHDLPWDSVLLRLVDRAGWEIKTRGIEFEFTNRTSIRPAHHAAHWNSVLANGVTPERWAAMCGVDLDWIPATPGCPWLRGACELPSGGVEFDRASIPKTRSSSPVSSTP